MSGISDAISSVLPWITTALTSGPVGIAAMAASKVAGVLGLGDTSPDAVKNALSSLTMTAEQKIALQKEEDNFKLQMQQMGFTHEEQLRADETNRLAIINRTMQGEGVLANWYAADWRPTWGYVSAFAFGFVVVVACLLAAVAIFKQQPALFDFIPKLIMAFIPLFGISGAVLGIQAWSDGRSDSIIAKISGGLPIGGKN